MIMHHTRKQQSEDRFDTISGTNGLLGAADGAFLLTKAKRIANDAMLDIAGRDQHTTVTRLFFRSSPRTLRLGVLQYRLSSFWPTGSAC